MISRRDFMRIVSRAGLSAASAPLWMHGLGASAFAETTGGYKAILVVTLSGGNDGNNTIIPLDGDRYSEYAAIRSSLAIPRGELVPMSGKTNSATYGLHPSLVNVGSLYNAGKALAVANVGPLATPVTKSQLSTNPALLPEALLSHPAGVAQWESAGVAALPTTGWGGRIADLITGQSGALPPVMDAGSASIFTVGRSVQGIAVPTAGASLIPLPSGLNAAIMSIAQNDCSSSNTLVAQAAQLRVQATNQQSLIAQAQQAGSSLSTQFPDTSFGRALQAIATFLNGRSVIGASRQIFYLQQGVYDTHTSQLNAHAGYLREFDGGIGAFTVALQEMGLQDQVLICTHSDFNRTLIANGSAGSDHAWGNHQLIIGGGIRGGRIIGTIPDPTLGGSLDLNGLGTWIPTLSVTQMTAAIGGWMGLTARQISSVFPGLENFAEGAISLA